ncbi:MAG: family 10 glycosylhydrolase, partial [Oscillospiraceae bacterium]|nr:family 10 glycosylhydrolase [Oscillospiraceae bacterium]
MKNKFKGAISIAAAICVLSGCSGRSEQNANIIDVGNAVVSGSLLPGSMSDPVSSNPQLGSSSDNDPGGSSSLPSGGGSGSTSSSSGSRSSSSSVSSSNKSSSSTSSESSPSIGPHTYPAKPLSSSEGSSTFMGSTGTQSSDTSSSSTSSSTTSLTSSEQPSSSSVQSTPVPEKPSSSVNTYKTLNYTEVKGVWISFLEIRDMPSNSPAEFRKAISAVYDNCVSLGINTVFVHARSHGDAYYDSELFPYTKWLSGGFDALEIMIDEAHKRNLSFQAWINPL